MAKYSGKLGFVVTSETTPGVWTEVVVERSYFGDVNRFSRRWQNASKINDDIDINNEISVVADIYAIENLGNLRYAEWIGQKWKITGIEVQYPRLILTVGGLYNVNTSESSD